MPDLNRPPRPPVDEAILECVMQDNTLEATAVPTCPFVGAAPVLRLIWTWCDETKVWEWDVDITDDAAGWIFADDPDTNEPVLTWDTTDLAAGGAIEAYCPSCNPFADPVYEFDDADRLLAAANAPQPSLDTEKVLKAVDDIIFGKGR